MSVWQPIDTAPKDGTMITVGSQSAGVGWPFYPYSLKAKFIDGKWCCAFGGNFEPYEPQPTHWNNLSERGAT